MALCLGGIFTLSPVGWRGSIIIMLGHGLCSSGLFALCYCVHEMFSSRSLFICRGAATLVPSLSVVWFLFRIANIGFPLRLNLLGEIFLLCSMVSYSLWFIFPLGVSVFLSGVYSLLLYVATQQGEVRGLRFKGGLLGNPFMVVGFLLWLPLNLLSSRGDVFYGCY